MSHSQHNPDACRTDPELESFDSTLQDRTSRVVNTLADGVEVRSLSLDSLHEVTGGLLDMNQQVVKVILDRKKDIWVNDQLFAMVEEYFEISIQTLDFYTSLENCLKEARSTLSFLQIAITQNDADTNHLNNINQLKQFKAFDSPFSVEFFELFQPVYTKQLAMLKNLQIQKGKVDKKMKSTKTWRRLSNVIFVAAFFTVKICSLVAGAVAPPPVVTALGKRVRLLWEKYEREFKDQREMISAMQVGSYIVIKDLDNIKALADKITEMEGLLQNTDFAMKEEDQEAVGMVVEETKTTVNVFAKTIEDFSDHSSKCIRIIKRARTVVLHRIIKYPSDLL